MCVQTTFCLAVHARMAFELLPPLALVNSAALNPGIQIPALVPFNYSGHRRERLFCDQCVSC
jgi:hypothetical protein